MLITRIRAENVLSFKALDVPLQDRLTIIVGPNGSGKSNLGRLVHLASLAVHGSATGDWRPLTTEYNRAGHFGSNRFHVCIGLDLRDEHSQRLIELWARVSVITSVCMMNAGLAPAVDRSLPETLGAADMFGRGELVIEHEPTRRHPWRVRWEAEAAGQRFLLDLDRNELRTEGHDETVSVPPLREWLGKRGDPLVAEPPGPGGSTLRLTDLLELGRLELTARPMGIDPEPASVHELFTALDKSLDTARSTLGFGRILDHFLGARVMNSMIHHQSGSGYVPLTSLRDADEEWDVTDVPTTLLRRKTGSAGQRRLFASAQEVFQRLTDVPLDVVQQAVELGPDAEALYAFPVVPTRTPDGDVVDVPLRLSGRGIEEAAALAVQLTAPAGIFFLDEPGSTLSAVAQRRLLRELLSPGDTRQTVLVTHSSHLVPTDSARDLERVIRLTRSADGATEVHMFADEIQVITRERQLLASLDIRSALFAAAALLVEGATEQEALTTWLATLDQTGRPTPASTNIVLLPVDGHDNFPKFARLMDAIGVPYGALADGPALRPGGPLRTMPNRPGAVTNAPATADFASQRSAWASAGVYTLADDYHDDGSGRGEIEALFEATDAALWNSIRGKGKIRRGAAFAGQADVPSDLIQVWDSFLVHVGVTDLSPATP